MQSKLTSENLNRILEFLSTKQSFEINKASNEFKQWMFEKYNFSVETFTDADFSELIDLNFIKGYIMVTSMYSLKPEGKVFLDNGGWVKKEKLENELIENSRKSLELAEANNKLTLSNKKIAKNTQYFLASDGWVKNFLKRHPDMR